MTSCWVSVAAWTSITSLRLTPKISARGSAAIRTLDAFLNLLTTLLLPVGETASITSRGAAGLRVTVDLERSLSFDDRAAGAKINAIPHEVITGRKLLFQLDRTAQFGSGENRNRLVLRHLCDQRAVGGADRHRLDGPNVTVAFVTERWCDQNSGLSQLSGEVAYGSLVAYRNDHDVKQRRHPEVEDDLSPVFVELQAARSRLNHERRETIARRRIFWNRNRDPYRVDFARLNRDFGGTVDDPVGGRLRLSLRLIEVDVAVLQDPPILESGDESRRLFFGRVQIMDDVDYDRAFGAGFHRQL